MTIKRRILDKVTNIRSTFSVYQNGSAVEDHYGYKGALAAARSYLIPGFKVTLVNQTKNITITLGR